MKLEHYDQLKKLTVSAMMLALALLLPFLTGQLQAIGQMLTPMHVPILLCGLLCGPIYGFSVGIVAAPLRFILFGMPQMPNVLYMTTELAVYGLLSGLFYQILPKRKLSLYISLILSMIGGRIAYALIFIAINLSNAKSLESLTMPIISATVLTAWPGMILQILLIPTLLIVLEKAKIIPLKNS
ncbi:MAG: ECF transporter S component [Clostridia bacterium]|nr:ECF transporter S component [Clostridia bacterium]